MPVGAAIVATHQHPRGSEQGRALAWLGKAFEERHSLLMFLEVDPMLNGLHSDPRFQDLVRRVGLRP